jgi:hypothetical protein
VREGVEGGGRNGPNNICTCEKMNKKSLTIVNSAVMNFGVQVSVFYPLFFSFG